MPGVKALEYGGKKLVVPAIVEAAKVEGQNDLVNFSASESPYGYLFAKVNQGEILPIRTLPSSLRPPIIKLKML